MPVPLWMPEKPPKLPMQHLMSKPRPMLQPIDWPREPIYMPRPQHLQMKDRKLMMLLFQLEILV